MALEWSTNYPASHDSLGVRDGARGGKRRALRELQAAPAARLTTPKLPIRSHRKVPELNNQAVKYHRDLADPFAIRGKPDAALREFGRTALPDAELANVRRRLE